MRTPVYHWGILGGPSLACPCSQLLTGTKDSEAGEKRGRSPMEKTPSHTCAVALTHRTLPFHARISRSKEEKNVKYLNELVL